MILVFSCDFLWDTESVSWVSTLLEPSSRRWRGSDSKSLTPHTDSISPLQVIQRDSVSIKSRYYQVPNHLSWGGRVWSLVCGGRPHGYPTPTTRFERLLTRGDPRGVCTRTFDTVHLFFTPSCVLGPWLQGEGGPREVVTVPNCCTIGFRYGSRSSTVVRSKIHSSRWKEEEL